MSLHENCLLGGGGVNLIHATSDLQYNPILLQGATGGTSRFALLHVTCYVKASPLPTLATLQRIQCKDYPKHVQNIHIALLCAIFLRDKKSWKIFVILFGGIKNSPYLCSRFSGARQFESKFSLCSLVQSLHRQLRPAEQFHRGSKNGHTYDRGEG